MKRVDLSQDVQQLERSTAFRLQWKIFILVGGSLYNDGCRSLVHDACNS
ncbi:hypothetical protein PanWU01x14_006400 [Parasponia andersonii]|uniref:Uncharacterized protein n=1 Tax=Parasponia andersonii TaxID=3476 RepID=A0A2P5E3U7_PARAD|nr:hypothetical protein PanWU01x14_006400 [Parasponia andersonii]